MAESNDQKAKVLSSVNCKISWQIMFDQKRKKLTDKKSALHTTT